MKRAVIGIDVGGTKTLCLLVDERFQILESIRFKTAPHKGRAHFTKCLINATRALKKHAEETGFKNRY